MSPTDRSNKKKGQGGGEKGQARFEPLPLFEQGPLKLIDKNILSILLGNGRMTNIEIASRLGSSEATVRRRIQNLIDEGVIQGFSVNIDYQKFGVNHLGVMVFIQVASDQLNKIVKDLSSRNEVYYVHQVVGNRFNLLCGVVFPDLRSMEKFLDALKKNKGIENVEYNLITESYVSYPCGL